jgi:hypothetical protein
MLLAFAGSAQAQLRPYDPFDWELFEGDQTVLVSAGAGVYWDQRASLAGTEGRLSEIGAFQALARTGRIALEASGTAYRFLEEKSKFAEPTGSADPHPLGTRYDSGDYRVSTMVLLTPLARPAVATLRFGSRLPTTDNHVGLERDQTDFFALVGGRYERGPVRVSGEAGVGIHGTRNEEYEQSDVLVYSLSVGGREGAVRPTLLLVGQADGLDGWAIRGNEELSEVRLRVRGGRLRWIQLEAIRGLEEFSPSYGVSLAVGMRR